MQPEFGMQGSDSPMTEREKLRQAFQIIGPLKLRFLLEHYPNEFPPNIFGDVVAWLRENEIDNAAAVERDRWSGILTWTTIVVVAVGVAGMLAAWTAAWPVAKGWIRSAGYSSYLRAMSARQELQRRLKRAAATIEPCLPRKAKLPPSGLDWLHEIKHDGFRILARKDGDQVKLITRSGYDFADR
jgi:hypothetical protein